MAKKDVSGDLTTKLDVRVTPRASTNAMTGYVDGVLSLRLTAPPVEGAANEACCAFVAGLLGVSKSQVTVAGGTKSRNKVLSITGMSSEQVSARLASAAKS